MTDQKRLNNILLNAIVDACTGAAFFGRLRWFGMTDSIIDYRASGNYLDKLKALKEAKQKIATQCHPEDIVKHFHPSDSTYQEAEGSVLASTHGQSPRVA